MVCLLLVVLVLYLRENCLHPQVLAECGLYVFSLQLVFITMLYGSVDILAFLQLLQLGRRPAKTRAT